jgi:hypothetical protein
MRRAIPLLLSISLNGLLAAAQEPTKPTPQVADTKTPKATVYVYRYKQFVGSALAPLIYCDGAELVRMENGRYFTANLEPARHTLTSNDKQSGST